MLVMNIKNRIHEVFVMNIYKYMIEFTICYEYLYIHHRIDILLTNNHNYHRL